MDPSEVLIIRTLGQDLSGPYIVAAYSVGNGGQKISLKPLRSRVMV